MHLQPRLVFEKNFEQEGQNQLDGKLRSHVIGRPLSSGVCKAFGNALFLHGNENEYGESVKTYV